MNQKNKGLSAQKKMQKEVFGNVERIALDKRSIGSQQAQRKKGIENGKD